MSANKKRVTRQIYYNIKQFIIDNEYTAKDDPIVQKKFKYGKTVIQAIRNTKNYDDYLARIHRFNGYPRKEAEYTAKGRPKTTKSQKKDNNEDLDLSGLVALIALGESEDTEKWHREMVNIYETDLRFKAYIAVAAFIISFALILFIAMLFVEFCVR